MIYMKSFVRTYSLHYYFANYWRDEIISSENWYVRIARPRIKKTNQSRNKHKQRDTSTAIPSSTVASNDDRNEIIV